MFITLFQRFKWYLCKEIWRFQSSRIIYVANTFHGGHWRLRCWILREVNNNKNLPFTIGIPTTYYVSYWVVHFLIFIIIIIIIKTGLYNISFNFLIEFRSKEVRSPIIFETIIFIIIIVTIYLYLIKETPII